MESKKALLIAALCLCTTGAVFAKLPSLPMTDEQKAKAAEAQADADCRAGRTRARTHGGCARQEITGSTAVEPRKSPGDSGLLFFAPLYACDAGA
ncbi:MAG: hypothetical protein HYU44_02835 [Betaproteobacteria bacterium]|nr:hypothetical protein [Betaproteobacteria bacterium]